MHQKRLRSTNISGQATQTRVANIHRELASLERSTCPHAMSCFHVSSSILQTLGSPESTTAAVVAPDTHKYWLQHHALLLEGTDYSSGTLWCYIKGSLHQRSHHALNTAMRAALPAANSKPPCWRGPADTDTRTAPHTASKHPAGRVEPHANNRTLCLSRA